MKKSLIVSLMASATAMCCAGAAFAAVGDQWSLSGDMQVASNPSPPIDPGAPGGGTGIWTYLHGNGAYTTSTTNVQADVNPEVPDSGIGWVLQGANHISLIRFSTDANPSPPFGTGNDATNFQVGDVGGHGTTGASWTTDHAGSFLVEWLGYNGRDSRFGPMGRQTFLRMSGPGGPGVDDLDIRLITNGVEDGSASAYASNAILSLAAGDSLTLMQEGGEWVGLDLTITEIPEPASAVLLLAGIIAPIWRRSTVLRD